MKNYIAKRSQKSLSQNDIIAIGNRAKEDAKKGNKVINAAIGTYLDDHKKVAALALTKQALSEHINDSLDYPNSLGDQAYLQGVFDYVFENKKTVIEQMYTPFVGSTLGGTGAISSALNLYLEEGETVLLPHVMWTNYKLVAEKAKVNYQTYEMFNEQNRLNIESIRKCIQHSFQKNKHTILLINDPCQNPTGYCMDKDEYDQLFAMLNEESSKGQLIVLFDIAYISFLHVNDGHCPLIAKLCEQKTSFLSLIAFSASKILGTYGLRLGALIALLDNEEESQALSSSFSSWARGTYSVPVGTAQAAVARLFNDPSFRDELRLEIKKNSDTMYERSKLLIKYLNEFNIDHYPYYCGFFVSIKVKDAFKINEQLIKEHMYVVPMDEKTIRIALSGMNEEEIVTLVSKINRFEKL